MLFDHAITGAQDRELAWLKIAAFWAWITPGTDAAANSRDEIFGLMFMAASRFEFWLTCYGRTGRLHFF